jgi:hypothetical protein
MIGHMLTVFISSLLRLGVFSGTHNSLQFHFIRSLAFRSVFNDFGPKFTCVDPTGEQPLTGMVVEIAKDKEGLVTTLDETRHGLEDGDFVTFSEVKGMEELNGCEPRKVSVKGPYTFTIGDTSGLGDYKSGGIFTQVKMPKFVEFVSLCSYMTHVISTKPSCRNRYASR